LNSSFLRSSTSSTSSTSPKNLESPASSCAYSVQESKFAASNSKSHSEEDDDLPLIDFSNDQDDEAQPGLLHWAVVAEDIPVEIGSPSLRNITVTQEDRLHISNVLECADLDRVIIVKFAIDITIRKLKCLRPRTWLNDEVINFYFNMLMSGLHREEGFYSFSSFFFVRLLDPNKGGYLYQNVRRWTTKVDIFSKKKIFFPINIDNTHWTLLLIDLTVKTIFYYDSYRKVGVYASHALRVGLFIYSFYYYGYYD
jgi:Ulp1 family protease